MSAIASSAGVASRASTMRSTTSPDRITRPYACGGATCATASEPSTPGAEPASRTARTVPARIAGVSPDSTSTCSARPASASSPTSTAWPVPFAGLCTAICTCGNAAATSSAIAGETTTTTSSAPASRAAVSTQASIGAPQTSCRTLGRWERMRVPSPPAMMIVLVVPIGPGRGPESGLPEQSR